MRRIDTLEQLLEVIRGAPVRGYRPEDVREYGRDLGIRCELTDESDAEWAERNVAYAGRWGLKLDSSGSEIDWGALPTFGGSEPAPEGLWSYDATREIRSDHSWNATITPRSDVAGE